MWGELCQRPNKRDTAPGDELFLALLANPEKHKTGRATGDHNQFWTDEDLVFEHRTSLVFDPPDGRLPQEAAEAATNK